MPVQYDVWEVISHNKGLRDSYGTVSCHPGKWKEHERLVAILEIWGADKKHSSSPQIGMSSGTVGETAGEARLINVSITLGWWHGDTARSVMGRRTVSSMQWVSHIWVNTQLPPRIFIILYVEELDLQLTAMLGTLLFIHLSDIYKKESHKKTQRQPEPKNRGVGLCFFLFVHRKWRSVELRWGHDGGRSELTVAFRHFKSKLNIF